MAKLFLLFSALSGFFAVALGAFGAHGLKHKLSADLLAIYQTAVQYQFYHTFALLALALWMKQAQNEMLWSKISGFGFLIGIVIFCGSLYLLAITGVRWLGAITPIGGLAWLLAWASFFTAVYKN